MSDRQDERSGDSPIKFATLGRCPRCGRGHLFAGDSMKGSRNQIRNNYALIASPVPGTRFAPIRNN